MLKIATWNVNSIRVRLKQLIKWLQSNEPDIVALQETKVIDADFPFQDLTDLGYHSVYCGQKTYNGVAILSKNKASDVVTEIPHFADEQRRYMAATIDGVRIINLYVPNGESVDSDKYIYKLNWLDSVIQAIQTECQTHKKVVVLGDFNIAPQEADVHDPVAWRGKVLFSDKEHETLERLLQVGFEDTFRLFGQESSTFSWWDYRNGGFEHNRGLRIDLILASRYLAKNCQSCFIDRQPRCWDRPSDHAPVISGFKEDSSA